jgi:hypothetical protein
MSKMSKALTIGEVAGTIGVSTHTLRYYEQAGLIRAVGRTQAGHRLYSPAELGFPRRGQFCGDLRRIKPPNPP